MSRSFVKNSAILASMNLLGGILGFGFHALVSRSISISHYGELQTYISIFSALGFLSTSVNYFVIQNLSPLVGDLSSLERYSRLIQKKVFKYSLAVVLALALCMPMATSILHIKTPLGLIIILISVFVNLQQFVFQGILSSQKAFVYLGLASLGGAFSKFLLGFMISKFINNPNHVSVVLLLCFMVSEIVLYLLGSSFVATKIFAKNRPLTVAQEFKNFSIRFDKGEMSKIVIFSLGIMLLAQWDILFIKYSSHDSEMVGVYGAYALLGRLLYWICFSIISVMLPEACSVASTSAPILFSIRKNAYILMCGLGISAFLVFYFTPFIPIKLFFGSQYLIHQSSLWMFGLSYFFLSLIHLEANLAFSGRFYSVSFLLLATLILESVTLLGHTNQIDTMISRVFFSLFTGYFSILSYNYINSKKPHATL